jgi:hypothetical protein
MSTSDPLLRNDLEGNMARRGAGIPPRIGELHRQGKAPHAEPRNGKLGEQVRRSTGFHLKRHLHINAFRSTVPPHTKSRRGGQGESLPAVHLSRDEDSTTFSESPARRRESRQTHWEASLADEYGPGIRDRAKNEFADPRLRTQVRDLHVQENRPRAAREDRVSRHTQLVPPRLQCDGRDPLDARLGGPRVVRWGET